MKLGTVSTSTGDRVIAQLDGQTWLVDASVGSLLNIVENWSTLEGKLRTGYLEEVNVDDVVWQPPIRRPGKLLCVALNNSANKDRIISGPDHPAAFIKPSSSLLGHRQDILLDPAYGRVHPEPELAVVIGKTGRRIAVEDAPGHVFGFTILNDLTAPIMRREDTFNYRAIHPSADEPGGVSYVESWVSYPGRYKGVDGFGPMGPWIATADEVPDPHSLPIRCIHDGKIITDDNTSNLRFKYDEIIAFFSRYMTLEAGDIISLGTALKASSAGGVVQNVDLARQLGTIEVEIEGIGRLSNTIALDAI